MTTESNEKSREKKIQGEEEKKKKKEERKLYQLHSINMSLFSTYTVFLYVNIPH